MFYFKNKETNEEYKVVYKHDRELRNTQMKPFLTTCFIISLSNNVVEYTSAAKCVATDNFCYKTGRKLSLKRVIEKTNFNKITRQIIWTKFFDMSK